LLDFVFSNFADLSVDHAEYGPVQHDHFHPPFVTDGVIPVRHHKQNFNISYERYSAKDYVVLYNALSTYIWSSLYNETSVDAAVNRLNVAVTQAMISLFLLDTLQCIHILIGFQENYIKKKNYFYRRYKKNKTDCFHDNLIFTVN
jgi:hypothetical protein